MKRVWFGAALGVILIALTIYSLLFSLQTASSVESNLENALTAATASDWERASENVERACEEWGEKRAILNVFFPHDPLELIGVSLEGLRVLADYEDTELFHVKCAETQRKISCLRECDLPFPGNIF